MKSTNKSLTKRSAWKSLATHFKETSKLHLRDLFANDNYKEFVGIFERAKRSAGWTDAA